MFLIRRAKPEDSATLLKLAKMVHFINLPPDKEIIDGKISWARQCFMLAHETQSGRVRPGKRAMGVGDKHAGGGHHRASASGVGAGAGAAGHSGALTGGLKTLTGRSPLFMFVMEEQATAGVIGTSQIIAKMGGPGQPNISLQLSRRELFSQSLQTGVTHTIAKMYLDESGPTEIGGLIMQPSFRGHRQKLGRLIAQVRFHYMGLYRHMFSDRVLAEMMGPISVDGHNPFWENCTRQFINMTYDEADKFCQETKEFILALFPREEIYLTLLPPMARSTVGTVGPDTVPAKRMLEKLGFKYHHRVDPFDGGPHLESPTDEISLVQQTRRTRLGEPVAEGQELGLDQFGIVSVVDQDGEFRALELHFGLDKDGKMIVSREALETLAGEPGMECGYTPTEPVEPARAAARARGEVNGPAMSAGTGAGPSAGAGSGAGRARGKGAKAKASGARSRS
jgi:arginine N-succinyltransferase